jgi:hypothetical protein
LKTLGGIAKDAASFMVENRRALLALGKIWIAVSLVNKFASLANSATQLAFSIAGSGASGAGGVAGAALTASTNMGALYKEVGLVGVALRGFVPIVSSLVAALQTGYEIWKWLEDEQKKKQEEENKRIRASVGKGAGGEAISIREGREQLAQYRKEWAQYEYDRRSLGEGGLDLLTGALSTDREDKQRQLAARRIQKAMDERWAVIHGNYMQQYKEVSQGVSGYETSEDVWRPGMGSFANDTTAIKNRKSLTTTGQSVVPEKMQLTWDPKSELKVTVQVNGLEGATASATLEGSNAPVTNEDMLGVPIG